MYVKADFQAIYAARLLDYPSLALAYRAQDPRVIGNLDSMAAMMAVISGQMDVAEFEPFIKVRDGTILADSTLKGILPLARAAKNTLTVVNNGTSDYTIESGRRIVDNAGRIHSADAAIVVPAGQTVTGTVTQKTARTATATIAPGGPYYRIQVPPPTDGTFLLNLDVANATEDFLYRPDYFNVAPGDLAYQVETDEYRNVYVVLGQQDVVGYEPQTGEVFTLTIEECEGLITDLAIGSTFVFEYVSTAEEGAIVMTLQSIQDQGQNAPDMSVLRQMAKYPAIYDHNAVYLGNFDFLLRRYLSPVTFLSVWNEQIEEKARGPSEANVNKLFVAGTVDGLDDPTFRARVADLIRRADDSYGIVNVAVNEVQLTMMVTAEVSVVHDPAEVTAQIRALVLGLYGRGQPAVSTGGQNPINKKALGKLLGDNVDALQDEISDYDISVTALPAQKPEDFVYVSDASLTVTVTTASYNTGLWNH